MAANCQYDPVACWERNGSTAYPKTDDLVGGGYGDSNHCANLSANIIGIGFIDATEAFRSVVAK